MRTTSKTEMISDVLTYRHVVMFNETGDDYDFEPFCTAKFYIVFDGDKVRIENQKGEKEFVFETNVHDKEAIDRWVLFAKGILSAVRKVKEYSEREANKLYL